VQNKRTGWRRPIGCLKLQIIFCKRATNYRALLRKMTYKDKASYESSTPCNNTRLGGQLSAYRKQKHCACTIPTQCTYLFFKVVHWIYTIYIQIGVCTHDQRPLPSYRKQKDCACIICIPIRFVLTISRKQWGRNNIQFTPVMGSCQEYMITVTYQPNHLVIDIILDFY